MSCLTLCTFKLLLEFNFISDEVVVAVKVVDEATFDPAFVGVAVKVEAEVFLLSVRRNEERLFKDEEKGAVWGR